MSINIDFALSTYWIEGANNLCYTTTKNLTQQFPRAFSHFHMTWLTSMKNTSTWKLMRFLGLMIPFVLSSFSHLQAADRYWVASSTSNWNNTANWSTSSGGAGGASVPSSSDYARFDSNGTGDCNLDIAVNLKRLRIDGYTGVIDLSGYDLTIASGSADMTFSSGTINDTPGTGSVDLTSSATIFFSGTTFGANLTVNTGRLRLDGSTFNGKASLTKTGGGNDNGQGGCTFDGVTSIINAGSADLNLGFTNPDIFNDSVTFKTTGDEIRIAYSSTGTQFNGNVVVESDGRHIDFGLGGGTSTLADGKTLTIGPGDFAGYLTIAGLTQVGSSPQVLTISTDFARLYFEDGTIFNGDLTVNSPRIYFSGGTFNGNASFTKTGGNDDNSDGGSTFNGTTTIVNSGTADLNMGINSPDIFNGDVTLISDGDELRVAHSSNGTQFNGNIIVESNDRQVEFGKGGGTSTLADGKTLSIGSGGFTDADLYLGGLIQLGSTAQTITMGANSRVLFENGSEFNANLTVTSPRIFLNGGTFNGTSSFTKTGAGYDNCAGGNTFNGITYFENATSTGHFWSLGETNPDIFNNDVTFYSSGDRIYIGNGSEGNQFNGNIIFESTARDVEFSSGGTFTLANGKTVSIGSTNGFTQGSLSFHNFTQVGNTAQNLTLTGTSKLNFFPGSVWNGNMTATTPRLFLSGSTFNGDVTLTKNGDGYDTGDGGNVFNGTTSITISVHSGNSLQMGNSNPDIFNGDVTFNGVGRIFVADVASGTQFHGDITINSPSNRVYFGASQGTVIMSGTADQTIAVEAATPDPSFYQLEINKQSGNLILDVPLVISDSLILTKGNIISSATNPLKFENDATVSSASDSSYVQGPVEKTGDDGFVFPIGYGGIYQPISIEAPDQTDDVFTAEYFASDPHPTYNESSKEVSIDHISSEEYWTMDRNVGTSEVKVTLSWREVSGGIDQTSELVVTRWDGSQWTDLGNDTTTGDNCSGTVTSTLPAVSFFGAFTLASTTSNNPLAILNQEPSFTVGADQIINADTSPQTVNGWATDLDKGATYESCQELTFTVTNDNNSLFDVQPAIDASGNLTYTPADDVTGTAIVTVSLSDDGGTANGGDDTYPDQTFNISINTTNGNAYYSDSENTDPNDVINWWSNTNNSGTHPFNFSHPTDTFIVQSGHDYLATANWDVANLILHGKLTTNHQLNISNDLFVVSNYLRIDSTSIVNIAGISIVETDGTISTNGTTGGVLNMNVLNLNGGRIGSSGSNDFELNCDSLSITNYTNEIRGVDLNVNGPTIITGTVDFTNMKGTKTYFGDVVINGTWNNTVNEFAHIHGDFIVNGSFQSGTGEYEFAGTNKIIAGSVSKIEFQDDLDITGSYENQVDTLVIMNDLKGPGIFTNGAGNWLKIAEDSYELDSLNATAIDNTVEYNGVVKQDMIATSYYNLLINNSAGSEVDLDSSCHVANHLEIAAGWLDVDGSGFELTGGDLTIGSGAKLELQTRGSTAAVPQFTGTYSLDPNSTVEFDHSGSNQKINADGIAYGHVIFSGDDSDDKDLQGNLDVNGDLTITEDAMLDVRSSNYTINVAGDWISNTTNTSSLYPREGNVIFDGTGPQQITRSGDDRKEDFYDLTISNNGGTVTMNDSIVVNHQLNFVTDGYLALNSQTLYVEDWDDGDITLGTDRFLIVDSNSTITINGVNDGETANFTMGFSESSDDFCRVDILNNDPDNTSFSVSACNYLNEEGTCAGGTAVSENNVNITWDIDTESTNADLTLYWDTSKELTGFDRTSSSLFGFTTSWDLLSSKSNATNFSGSIYAKTESLTTFNTLSIGSGKIDQTITFNALADKTFGDADFDLSASASSGLEITYVSSNTSVATVSGNTVTIVGAGSTTITASQAGDDDYNAAVDVDQTLTVNKAAQAITFNALADKTFGDADFNLSASASSGLGITYVSSNTSVATVSGNTVTIVGTGSTTITASQAGDDDYNAAVNVDQTLTINKAAQAITFNALADKTFGDADFDLSASASSGLEITYVSSNTSVATVSGNTVTIVGAGSTTITASQAGDDDYNAAVDVDQTLTVNKAAQAITFNALADKTFGDADFNLSASASSGLGITYVSSNTSVATVSGNTVTIVGTGSTTITASQAGDDDYNAAVAVDQTLTVNKAAQTITFNALADKTFGDADFNLSASASSGLGVTYISSDLTVATVSGNTVTIVGAGSTTITASQAGDDDYNAAIAVDQTLTVNKAAQAITFNALADKTFGDADFNLSASASSGLGITYVSSNTSVATVSGNTVTIVGAGSTTITASQAGDDDYNAAVAVNQTLTVNKAAQAITFNALADKTFGDADFNLSASASSGLGITYVSSNTSVATVSGNTVTIVGAGSTTITASQGGDDDYNAAIAVDQTLTVNKAAQAITFNALADKTFGDADFALSASASSGMGVSYVSSNTSVATVSGNTVTIVGAGSTTITASQGGDDDYNAAVAVDQTLTINKATQSITFNALADKTFGDADFALSASASSGLGITYVSSNTSVATVSGNTVTIVGAGSTTITATQAGDDDYNAAIAVDQTLTINKAAQAITFNALADKTFGDADFNLSASASSGLGVSYTSSDLTVATVSGNTVTIVGAGSTTITASQAGDDDYNAAIAVDQTLTVNKAAQAITFNALIDKTFGDADFDLSASASSGLGVTYVSSNTSVATVSGNTVTIVGAGSTTITASQAGDDDYNAAVDVDQTLTVNKAAQAITFNALADKTFGDADFNLSASASSGLGVSYTSSDLTVATVSGNTVTIVGAGSTTITASQAGDDDYNAAIAVDQTLTVNKAAQAITFNALIDKTFGDADFNLSASASSGLGVTYVSSNTSVATVSGNTVTIVGAGSTTITASQAGDDDYNATVAVDQTLTVNKAAQAITFNALIDKTFGDADFDLSASASSGLGVTYVSSNTSVATVSGNTVTIIGAGSTTITASQGGDDDYNAAVAVDQTLTINKAAQAITFNALADKTFGDADFDLSASASSGLGITYVSSNTSVATVSGNTVTIIGAGSTTITASQGGDDDYNAAVAVDQTLTVNKAAQSITFNALIDKTFGDADFDLSASASSGLGITYVSSNTSVATVSGNTVTIVGAGSTTITASQGGDDDYNAAVAVDQTLTVNKAAQSITFNALIDKTFGDADFDLSASASSGLEITYVSSNTSVATVSGNTVTIIGAGSTTITASQAGDDDYNAAVDVDQTLTVNKAAQAITFNALADKTFGDADFDLSASASSGLGVSYTSSDLTVATVSGNTVTIVGAGSTTITASQAGNDDYNAAVAVDQTLTVNKAAQTITFNALTDKTFGDADFNLTATSSSGLGVSYVSSDLTVATVSGNTVTIVGAGSTTITASQAGDDDYNAAVDVDQTLTVNKAAQAITFNALADKTFGDADFDLSASASSGLGVSYTSSDLTVATVSGNTVTIVGAGSTTITASQAGNDDYNAAVAVDQTLTVNKAAQTITFNALTDKTFGDADFNLTATSSSGLGVSYVSSDLTVATVSGNTVTIVGAGSTTITASQAGDDDYNAAVDVDQTLTVNKASQSITFNALADKTFGDADFDLSASASSGLGVSYTSSDLTVATVSGNTVTIVGAGSTTITASQAGDDDYNAAIAVDQTLTVNKAAQAITFNALIDKTFGDADFDLSASASSGLGVTYVSSDLTVATVSGNAVTIVGAGSTTITASQAGDDDYNAAVAVDQTLTVNKSAQTITFNALIDKTFGDADFDLSASASSGLGVKYVSSNTSVATVSGNTVTIVGAGSTTITASQAGDDDYNAAVDVDQTLTVNKAAQAITFNALADKTFGDADFNLSASASSGLGVSYTSSDLTVATVSGNTVTIVGAGSTTITASQGGDDDYNAAVAVDQTLTINKATQSITFNALADKTFGDADFALSASASSGLGITYVSSNTSVATVSGNTVTIVGAGSTTITATQAGDDDYNAAIAVDQTLTINKAAQAITFNALADKTFGDADFALSASASSGLGVSYTSSDLTVATVSGNTVTIVGAGSTTITASQGGNDDYNAAIAVDQTLTVNKAAQAITFNALADKTFGDADFNLSASASSGLGVSYTSSDLTVATVSGNTVTIVGAGSTTITASQAGDDDYNAAVDVDQTLTVNKAAQAITFNALADKTFGDADFNLSASASSGLGITYVSSNTSVATVSGNTVTIVGTGSTTITASQAGDDDYNAAVNVDQTLTINKAAQTITFNALADKTFGDADFDLSASASSGLGITYVSSNTSVATVSGNTVTIVGTGSTTITASQDGDDDYNAAVDVDQTLTINKAAQTITFNALADKTFGDADFDLSASASSGLGVSYTSSDLTVATVSGNTVTIVGAGSTTITASQGGNDDYNAAIAVDQTLTVNKAAQTITFNALADKTFGDADFDLSASASSGLEITYVSSNTSVATVSGNTVTIVGAGSTTITASQAGDDDYNAAVDVDQTLTVNKAAQAITFNALADKTFGDADFNLSASASSGLGITYVSSNTSVATVSGNTVTIVGTGSTTITASQAGDDDYNAAVNVDQTLTINKAAQAITFNALADKTFGDADFDLSASASSGLEITYVSSNTSVATVSGNTVTIVGAGSTTITASQAGDDDYNAAVDVDQTLTVNKAAQAITFNALADKTFGDADFNLSASASSGLGITYVSSNTSVATVSGNTVTIVGTGSTTITASQAGDDDYNAAVAVDQTLTVNKAAQTITFNALADKTFGDADFNLSASASSGLGVTYISSDLTVATVSGNTVTIVGAGSTTITASQAGDDDYNAAIAVDQTLTVNKAAQAITFNALADKTFGDADFNLSASASSGLGITYVSSNTSVATVSGNTVTIVGAGSTTITASQAGDDDYNAAVAVNQTLTVNKAAQAITFNALADKTFGDADFNLSASASSGLGITYVSSNTSVATVSGNTVTIVGAGSTTITASQGGDDDYNAAIAVDQTLTVNKAAQAITFNALADKTFGDADFALSASASSGMGVSYVSSNTSVATVSGNTVTIVGAGSTTITASQGGDDDYNAAVAVDQTLTINKATQSITFNALADKTFGDADFALSASASSGLGITYVSSNTSVATVSGNTVTIVGAGSTTITATQAGDDDYNAAIAVDQTLTINKAAQAITFNALADKTFGDADFNLSASASSGLGVSYTSSDLTVATVSGNTVTIVGAGSTTITASQAGDDDYNAAIAVDQTLTVNKAAQAITFNALIDKTFGDADFDLSASASSGLGVTYVSSNTSVATVSGNTVTIVGAGSTTITASQAGDDDYNAAVDVDQTLTVNKAAQAITFNALADKTFGDADFNLSASASSGLGVSYTSSDLTVATVSGNTVTIVGAGSTTITASQAGDDDYNAAIAVDQTLTVNKAAQAITFNALIDKTFGDADFNLSASASSGLGVTYVSSNTSVATVSGNTVTIVGAGSTTITASQAGDDDYNATVAVDQTLTVNKAAQAITFNALIDKTFGDADFDLSASASSGLGVTYVSSNTSVATVSGNTVTIIGAGSTTITASQGGDDDYNAAVAVDQTLTINKAAQAITFNALADKTFGDADFDLSASASSGLGITYVSSNTSVATVSGNTVTIIGAGSTTITASQGGDDDYNAAVAVDQTLTVNKAAQSITFNALIDKTFGDADFDLSASASSGLGITYVSSNTSVATVSGNTVTIVGAGSTTITASQGGDDDYNAAVAVDQTLTVNKAAQSITFNALIDKTFGDADFDLSASASSGLEITYVSSNTSVATVSGNTVTIIGAGSTTITASQAGDDDYNAAVDVDQTLTVNKAAQAITFNALADKTFGDADFDLSASASSGLGVSYTSSDLTVATVSGNTVTIVGAGSTTITASQAGDDDYNAAIAVDQTLTVNKAAQAITFNALIDKTFGDADFDLSASASSGLGVTYVSSDLTVATVSGNAVTIVGAGSTTITASQAGDDDYNAAVAVDQTLTVNKSAQTITFNALIDKTFGDADFDLSASASSGLSVSYTSSDLTVATVSGNTVTIVGAGSTTITASQGGDDDYNAAVAVNQTLMVNNKTNKTPSFTAGADQVINEDAGAQSINAWATAINTGAGNEADVLSFNVSNDNNSLFSVQPSVDASGTLTYTPAADAFGSATVSVELSDGTATTPVQTFDITVNAVNDAPSFVAGADQVINEDAGAQSINAWATAINTGAGNEADVLSFNVSNDNNSLFSVQPSVDASGTLTYTPAADAFGSAIVSVELSDGMATSSIHTFDITVNAVNDAPSFVAGADQVINEDAGAQSINAWATAINTGAGNEADVLSFNVSNDNNSLFSVQPSVDASGTLTYTPAADAFGSAIVSVELSDGTDTTPVQTFDITVNKNSTHMHNKGLVSLKPNKGLSPNSDGINDYWIIAGIENYPDNWIEILNRDGQVVFSLTGYDNRSRVFTGVSNNNNLLPDGPYFYQIKIGNNDIISGFIVLKR